MPARITLFLCTLGLTAVLTGCDDPPRAPIRLGTNAWPGYTPLHLAEEIGALDGLNVDLVDLSSTNDLLKGLAVGSLDGGGVTLEELLNARDLGMELVIVIVTDVSNGADAILAQPQFTTLEELRGKRIGCEATALCGLMLYRAADSLGLSPDDFQQVPLSLPQHESAFAAGEVDAVVTFEPVLSALKGKGANVVFNSAQIPNEIIDVIAIKREVAEQNPEQVAQLVSAWFRGVNYLEQYPEAALNLIDKRLHMGPQELEEAFAGLIIPDAEKMNALLANRGKELIPTLSRIEKIMLLDDQISEQAPLENLFQAPNAKSIRNH